MTIKELENKTGMARANIRFYEEEGLLSPKRLPNGYRDYSEEDVRTLEKIKLLRQLQLDIDTIRKVQGGALTLEQALFVQLTRLEGDRTVIERAAQVCRELERSGVEYAALEPQPWLQQLEAPRRAEIPAPPPAVPEEDKAGWDDEPRACYHPWMRLFARSLDMALYDTLINVLWLLAFRDQSLIRLQTWNLLTQWMWGLLMLALTLALEPLWLHFWGWTPGKWLFGLKVRYINGDKLPLGRAWDRSWGVFRGGYGWDIPLWRLWKMWRCRELGLVGRDCDWDVEECCHYTKVGRRFSGWAYVGAQALLGAALLLALLGSCLPACRGDLTVAEFARNFNQYHRRFGWYSETEPRLDKEGHWTGGAAELNTVIRNFTHTNSDGTTRVIENVVGGTTVWDEPEFTLADGRVTAVTLHWGSRDSMIGSVEHPRVPLCLLAMSGAVDGLNAFNYRLEDWLEQLEANRSSTGTVVTDGRSGNVDWEAEIRGLRVRWQVEFTGYEAEQQYSGPFFICVDGDAPLHYEETITISLVE